MPNNSIILKIQNEDRDLTEFRRTLIQEKRQ